MDSVQDEQQHMESITYLVEYFGAQNNSLENEGDGLKLTTCTTR